MVPLASPTVLIEMRSKASLSSEFIILFGILLSSLVVETFRARACGVISRFIASAAMSCSSLHRCEGYSQFLNSEPLVRSLMMKICEMIRNG